MNALIERKTKPPPVTKNHPSYGGNQEVCDEEWFPPGCLIRQGTDHDRPQDPPEYEDTFRYPRIGYADSEWFQDFLQPCRERSEQSKTCEEDRGKQPKVPTIAWRRLRKSEILSGSLRQ